MNDKVDLVPKKINEFVGQSDNIKILKTAIFVAKEQKTCIDHTLIYGNSGLGKTTLAKIVSNELESNFIYISAPSISTVLELISIISSIQENDVLFIDEIHRMSQKLEEVLYTVMENFKLSFIYNSEENAKPLEIALPKFTLIAATTMVYRVSTPLRNRFPIQIKLEDYSLESIEKMTVKMFKKMKISITKEAVYVVAKSSRKNPRILKNNCKRILDYAIYKKLDNIDVYQVLEVLNRLKIFDDGLNMIDIELLRAMLYKFNNKPISLETAALVLGESKQDITQIHEPYLVENGYIIRTKRGRILSEKAIQYLEKIDKK
jgi:Holliday junction DNA helicase RuvB